MPIENYRYYDLDGAGLFGGGEWLEANNDEEAVEQIVSRHGVAPWEIWHGERIVARQTRRRHADGRLVPPPPITANTIEAARPFGRPAH